MGFVGRPLVPLWSLTQLGLTWVPQLLHLFHFVLLEILLLVIYCVWVGGVYVTAHVCGTLVGVLGPELGSQAWQQCLTHRPCSLALSLGFDNFIFSIFS